METTWSEIICDYGMVEINDSHKTPWEDVFQVKHGLLFRVLPENNKQ